MKSDDWSIAGDAGDGSCSPLFPYNGINQMVTLRRNLLLLSTALVAIGVATAQSPGVPGWQTAAGGKMAFEVASVKPAKMFRPPNFPLDPGDAKTPGGRFSATFSLVDYVAFAHKLMPGQIRAQLPKSFQMD